MWIVDIITAMSKNWKCSPLNILLNLLVFFSFFGLKLTLLHYTNLDWQRGTWGWSFKGSRFRHYKFDSVASFSHNRFVVELLLSSSPWFVCVTLCFIDHQILFPLSLYLSTFFVLNGKKERLNKIDSSNN